MPEYINPLSYNDPYFRDLVQNTVNTQLSAQAPVVAADQAAFGLLGGLLQQERAAETSIQLQQLGADSSQLIAKLNADTQKRIAAQNTIAQAATTAASLAVQTRNNDRNNVAAGERNDAAIAGRQAVAESSPGRIQGPSNASAAQPASGNVDVLKDFEIPSSGAGTNPGEPPGAAELPTSQTNGTTIGGRSPTPNTVNIPEINTTTVGGNSGGVIVKPLEARDLEQL